VLHTVTSQYRRLCRSNGGTVVVFVLGVHVGCRFLNLFLCSSRESNELFLGAASVMSRPEIIEVSIAGKHIFVSCLCRKCLLSTPAFDKQSFGGLLGDRDQYSDYVCMKL